MRSYFDAGRVTVFPGSRLLVTCVALVTIFLTLSASLLLPAVPSREVAIISGSVFATIVLFLVVATYGTRGLISLSIFASLCFLATNNIRLNASIALSDMFFLIAFALILPQILSKGPTAFSSVASRSLIKGSVLLSLGALIASVASGSGEDVVRWVKLSIAVVIIPIVVLEWRPGPVKLRILTWCYVFSSTASGCVAIVVDPPDQYQTRAYGLATHPNTLALTSVVAVGAAIALLQTSRGLLKVVAGGSICVLLWTIAFASGSRAGVIGLVAVLVAVIWLNRSVRMARMGIVLGAILALLIGTSTLNLGNSEAIGRLIGSGDTQEAAGVAQSDQGRLIALEQAKNEFISRPFIGVGLRQALSAHNVYVSVLVSTGILGLLGWFAVIIGSLKPAFLNRRSLLDLDDNLRILLFGWTSSFVGLLAADMFQNALWERYVWIPPAVIAAIAALGKHSLPPGSELPDYPKSNRPLLRP